MYTAHDWRILRAPLLALSVAVLAVGVLDYFSYQYQQKQKQKLALEKQNLFKARQTYQASGHEKETITRYLPLYQRLIDQHFIGEEQRIEWLDVLRQTQATHKLFSINYDIGEQTSVTLPYLAVPTEVALQRSKMHIEMGLLHEGDILTVLQSLQTAFNYFVVQSCEIKRMADSRIQLTGVYQNMRANCEIDWFTLKDPRLEEGL